MDEDDSMSMMTESILDAEEEYLLQNKTDAFKKSVMSENITDDKALRHFIRDHMTYESWVSLAMSLLEEAQSEIATFKGHIKVEESKQKQQKQESLVKQDSQFKGVKKNVHRKWNKKSNKNNWVNPNGDLVIPAHRSFNMVINIMLGIKRAVDLTNFPAMYEL